mmetsp:Transcript_25842/g.40073  ORF Transcript_25842/g.40073 Transcript_25842/m.40073 type:complete len:203 (+) Transcript_25842:383-991(+)
MPARAMTAASRRLLGRLDHLHSLGAVIEAGQAPVSEAQHGPLLYPGLWHISMGRHACAACALCAVLEEALRDMFCDANGRQGGRHPLRGFYYVTLDGSGQAGRHGTTWCSYSSLMGAKRNKTRWSPPSGHSWRPIFLTSSCRPAGGRTCVWRWYTASGVSTPLADMEGASSAPNQSLPPAFPSPRPPPQKIPATAPAVPPRP